jgi:hypothetical protein
MLLEEPKARPDNLADGAIAAIRQLPVNKVGKVIA